ncbi:eukaryotic translation initiation factor 5, putative [Plasmodium sp. DRC-Itaito]|nr:eukaryotic translation initiation factor 5, putative [Plasmodium sp. DRC-Itaito]
MSYVNIPRDRNDPNYRYKMPKLISKIEGRGNGIRTNISNMGEIARSLKRPPMYPTKFFGCELGTMVKFEENEEKAIVNGAHKEKDLVNILDKFIEMYVLCPHCLLPETDIVVKKGILICKCNACGNIGELNNSHKIATYMIKNPPMISTVGSKKKKTKEKKVEKSTKGKSEKTDKNEENNRNGVINSDDEENDDSDDLLDSDKSISNGKKENKKNKKKDNSSSNNNNNNNNSNNSSSNSKKKKEEENFVLEKECLHFGSPEIKEVIERMKTIFKESTQMNDIQYAEELRVLQVSQCFDSKCRVFICLCSLFEDKISKELLEKNIKYIKKINDTSVTTTDIFLALEYYVNNIAPNSLSIYPYILQVLYNNDIFESKDIIKRYDDDDDGKNENKNNNKSTNSNNINSNNITTSNNNSNNSTNDSLKTEKLLNNHVNNKDDNNTVNAQIHFDKCKSMAKHFVSWLKDNDSDSEESDDEEEKNTPNNTINSNMGNLKVKSLRINDGNLKREHQSLFSNDYERVFVDSKSEKCDDDIFLDAKDGNVYTGDEEEEIDIDAI